MAEIVDPFADEVVPTVATPASHALPVPPEGYTPVDESTLTPEQIQIRELTDRLARAEGKRDSEGELEDVKDGESILIHFLVDGFTAIDRVWFRGQEVEFIKGSQAYEDTKDRNGNTWLDYDVQTQMQKWGVQNFGFGPWPGQPYQDETAAAQEAKRGRAAPRLPVVR